MEDLCMRAQIHTFMLMEEMNKRREKYRERERKRGRAGRKRTERNWRRANPSVSVIVSCCRTRGNSLTAEEKRER